MLRSDYDGQDCSIARALEVVGERWTLLIVRELLLKPRRFGELERRLGVSKNLLATRLDKLVDMAIVEKGPNPDRASWSTYALTDKGMHLFPVLSALMAWGDAYYAPSGAPVVFEHHCGHPAGHAVACVACGGAVDRGSIRPMPGPGFLSPEASPTAAPPTTSEGAG